MEVDKQTDRVLNKRQDRRRDSALRHLKATGAAGLLLAPAAHRAK